jgi:hypothetical protein
MFHATCSFKGCDFKVKDIEFDVVADKLLKHHLIEHKHEPDALASEWRVTPETKKATKP